MNSGLSEEQKNMSSKILTKWLNVAETVVFWDVEVKVFARI